MSAVGRGVDHDSVLGRATESHPRVARDASTSDVHSARRTGGALGPELHAGDTLEGRYILLSPLGEGGMGDVWLAHNPTLDMDVALKVLRVDESRPDLREQMTHRLLMEARATAKLGHPAIVRIIDFGETEAGNGFYVMELLDGEDLCALIARHGHLSPAKAVRTLLPIAGALVAAHAKAIVHRDIKPENIFLARDREQNSVQPKLIDFGIAKLSGLNERVTAAGAVMGSPGYMAPEQARGEEVDTRADVWGFCVVLYETITGRLPFEGRNFFALMRAIVEDEPAPASGGDAGDEVLWSVIRRGLEKDPGKRWQTMRQLGCALASWLVERGIAEDICGAQLSTLWLQPEGEVGQPPQDPFVSVSISRKAVDSAMRERSEMFTLAPPVVSDTALPRRSLLRSKVVAVAAVALGIGGGIAFGAWPHSRPTETAGRKDLLALAPSAVDAQVAAPSPRPSDSERPAVAAPSAESASAPVSAVPPARARPSSKVGLGVLPSKASTSSKPSTASPPTPQAQDPAPPSSMLKNPF
jgi:eukaryotic-like serine/threonine-protein kinase